MNLWVDTEILNEFVGGHWNPNEIYGRTLNSLINATKKHDKNNPGRPEENDTPSPNLLVVLVVVLVLASREWKAGSVGNKFVGGHWIP